jgi:hypothetical protein
MTEIMRVPLRSLTRQLFACSYDNSVKDKEVESWGGSVDGFYSERLHRKPLHAVRHQKKVKGWKGLSPWIEAFTVKG